MNPLRLAWVHFKVQAQNEFQYRVNLVIQLINSAVGLATGLVAISLIFSHTGDLGGWSRQELLIVMGVHIGLRGVVGALIEPNMRRLMEDIEEGNFDFALTRPADAQLLVSVRNFRIWELIDVVVGAGVVAYAAGGLPASVGNWRVPAFLAAVVMGIVVMYCVWLAFTTLSFRIIRGDEIIELYQGLYQAGRFPVSIYPGWLRGTLTFVLPLALAVTVPAETLSARLSPSFLLVGAAITAAVVLLTRFVWLTNLRRYSGASA
jgi:ABC-2 type transport system permease protein